MKRAEAILHKVFGYRQFRPLQREIIQAILSGRDSVVIMPTGGGKSLCYQIPAMIFDGLTVVVSPLISLMKDQVQQLRQFGIPALYLNSTLSRDEYRMNRQYIYHGDARLLYVAPETLMLDGTISLLERAQPKLFAIDEAHCISEWGHDFRPEYRQLANIKSLFPDAVTAALTATATPRVQDDIAENLKLTNPERFIASFDRKNLMLEVVQKRQPKKILEDFLPRFDQQSGIIYCTTRKKVDEIAELLIGWGYLALPYHAGLSDRMRHDNQEKFIRDDVQIIVATIAFGMGINKPNVRFIVHYDLPKNIESYYQQIGRAGRDGMIAHCLLMFGYADITKIKYFIEQMFGHEKLIAEQHLQQMIRYAEFRLCRREMLLEYFGEEYENDNCGMCDNCLSEPHEMTDLTIPAQKFLSCVKRTGESFGARHVIGVLKGSEQKSILDRGHDRLSTYGIGDEYDREQWFDLSRQFIQMGLLDEGEHRELTLTQKAWKVLRGIDKVVAFQPQKSDKKSMPSKNRGKARFADIEYDEELFEILRKKRKEIADESGIPPYTVFSDKTFVEMAYRFPRTQQQMMAIFGIGKRKYNRYGKIFIEIIDEYCNEKGIELVE